MSLILHLMKKDARYLRYELAIWLLLLLAQAGLVLSGVDARVAQEPLRTLSSIYWALTSIRLVIATIFVAQLVHSDPLTGTTAFWRTRPIGRGTLMASKLGLAALVLLIPPFVVDLLTFLALQFNLSASLGVATAHLLRLATLLLPALALAVVTPDIARFVVSAVLLVVGVTLAQWTALALALFAPLGGAADAATLTNSRLVALLASSAIFSLAIVVHQFLSLKTHRSIVAIPVAIIGCVVVMNSWWIDFRARPEPTVDRATFDPEPISLALDSRPWDSIPVMTAASNARVASRRLVGHLVISGVPPAMVVEPLTTESTLTLPSGTTLRTRLWARPLTDQQGALLRPNARQRAAIEMLGPLAWSNLESTIGPDIGVGLADVPEAIYKKFQGAAGNYSAEVKVQAFRFEATCIMPLGGGAGCRTGSTRTDFIGVERTDRGWRVSLREISLKRDATDIWRSGRWDWGDGKYLLVNRTRKEALFPMMDLVSRAYDDSPLSGIDSYLAVGRRLLDLTATPGPGGPAIDAAWLAEAELVRVEPVSLGVFTKPLKVDNFVLPPLK